jgi:hypothetical protein
MDSKASLWWHVGIEGGSWGKVRSLEYSRQTVMVTGLGWGQWTRFVVTQRGPEQEGMRSGERMCSEASLYR